jgi:DNA-directed RNA polymerase subunit RPC12/RpoP
MVLVCVNCGRELTESDYKICKDYVISCSRCGEHVFKDTDDCRNIDDDWW